MHTYNYIHDQEITFLVTVTRQLVKPRIYLGNCFISGDTSGANSRKWSKAGITAEWNEAKRIPLHR